MDYIKFFLQITKSLIFGVLNASFPLYSGPTLVLALTRENAVAHWRNLLGPKTVEEAKKENPNR